MAAGHDELGGVPSAEHQEARASSTFTAVRRGKKKKKAKKGRKESSRPQRSLERAVTHKGMPEFGILGDPVGPTAERLPGAADLTSIEKFDDIDVRSDFEDGVEYDADQE